MDVKNSGKGVARGVKAGAQHVGAAGQAAARELTHEAAPQLEALARVLETGKVLDVTAFGGFPYADTADAGGTAMAFADGDAEAAQAAVRVLAEDMYTRRAAFDISLPTPAEGIARALNGPPGLVCVTDPADNPYSGGIGDTPELFRALLQLRPVVPTVFALFCDAKLVAQEIGRAHV